MATVYVIAGPPGIGKSTSGREFVPDGITVLDADLIVQRYRQEGFSDYKQIGNWRYQHMLNQALISGKDFALELNLGFQAHYELLKNLKSFSLSNKIEVVLFHTDDLQLCLERARERHEEGLHLVPPETVREMYYNTIPLLKKNIELISVLRAIDVSRFDAPGPCLKFDREEGVLGISELPIKWLDGELIRLLETSGQKQGNIQSLKGSDAKIDKSSKKRNRRRM